jgi:hypothetical protein
MVSVDAEKKKVNAQKRPTKRTVGEGSQSGGNVVEPHHDQPLPGPVEGD